MKKPLVSIIIPYYNAAGFIGRALQYASQQVKVTKEIIVVDDGSSIAAKNALSAIENQIDRLISQENMGPSAARNAGIQVAKGEFILVWDSDDFFEKEFSYKAVNVLSQKRDVKLVSSWANKINDTGGSELYKPAGGDISNFIRYNAATGSCMFRKADWERSGGYDEAMRTGFEDWEFFIRLLKDGGQAFILKEVLFTYSVEENNRSREANRYKLELRRYIYLKNRDAGIMCYDQLVEHLLLKIEREEKEKIKKVNKKEFLIGKAILDPLRIVKRFLNVILGK